MKKKCVCGNSVPWPNVKYCWSMDCFKKRRKKSGSIWYKNTYYPDRYSKLNKQKRSRKGIKNKDMKKLYTLKEVTKLIKEENVRVYSLMSRGVVMDKKKYSQARNKEDFSSGFALGCNISHKMLKKILKIK